MSELPQIMMVERVGVTGSPIHPKMQAPRIGHVAVLADAESDAEFLSADILLSLGKSTSRGRLPTLGEQGIEAARIWLGSEEIGNLFVGGAERLDASQLTALDDLSETSRIWLLFTGSVTDCAKRELAFTKHGTIGNNSLRRWLDGKVVPEEPDWTDFPALPMTGPLTFRATCQEILDPIEMARVDDAILTGVTGSRYVLDENDGEVTAERVARDGLDASVPPWPALAMLRGAQLGALSMGWALRFDTSAWFQITGSVPALDENTLRAIRETVDPRDGALVIVHSCTAASPSKLLELTFGDVATDRESIFIDDREYEIPRSARGVFKAHCERIHDADDNALLFPTPSRKQSARAAMAHRLTRALRRLGLPEAIQMTANLDRAHDSVGDLGTHIDLSLVQLPNA